MLGMSGNLLMDWFRYNATPTPPPTDTYVAEDGVTVLVAEDNVTPYVPEQ